MRDWKTASAKPAEPPGRKPHRENMPGSMPGDPRGEYRVLFGTTGTDCHAEHPRQHQPAGTDLSMESYIHLPGEVAS